MKGPIKTDIWAYWGVADALCITTNGCVVKGECVMGRGIALQAKQRFPGIALHLGRCIQAEGNSTRIIPGTTVPMGTPSVLVALPTKHGEIRVKDINQVLPHFCPYVRIGQLVPGWKMCSDPVLIVKSLMELTELADNHNWQSVVLPPPGVGNGSFNFYDSVDCCRMLLDDRFTVVYQ